MDRVRWSLPSRSFNNVDENTLFDGVVYQGWVFSESESAGHFRSNDQLVTAIVCGRA